MTTYTIEERAQAAIDLLDAEYPPDWDARIDLSRLNMARPCDCLGGQLEGRYSLFAVRTGIRDRGELTIAGFNPDGGVPGENEALTAAIRDLIAARRRARLTVPAELLAVPV